VDIPRQTAPEAPRDTAPPVRPERGGLSLGGPSEAMPSLKSPPSAPGDGAAPRRSFRDQIASLGSRLGVEDAPAKQTVHLDTQEPRFLDYLARVKRRIERVWTYPEEAWGNGISGELLLIFTLNKAGTLTSIRLVHSSGFPVLDQEALRAVKTAAPYDPFPPQLGEDPWNIAASFHYNLPPRRFRRN
jgi:TonB family protein